MKLRTRKKRLARHLTSARRRERRKCGWTGIFRSPGRERDEIRRWLGDPLRQRAELYSWLAIIREPTVESLRECETKLGATELYRRALAEMCPCRKKNGHGA